ncbi:hypothetical protein M413DRAFT_443873 [Hebeloma cylindrosporum]|uniref:Uncharacterized protein n=1 Tax=Hebeloma cylindrosporum TaxID=76867 RepID=A0A0C3CFW5_HEBCY|nr:hypothetical protein M413DRAFT_443873 [Hebeloma cylindrosporum h7]
MFEDAIRTMLTVDPQLIRVISTNWVRRSPPRAPKDFPAEQGFLWRRSKVKANAEEVDESHESQAPMSAGLPTYVQHPEG